MTSSNRTPIVIAILGIVLEAVVLYLLSSKQISEQYATPLIITGMLMAFVPLFVLSRRSRKR